ncbi:MAG: WYL domain-containing protein [Muribaculaceae bacterium]|nr:WYL domain-containing protein [Muribaculaceae bacterium]
MSKKDNERGQSQISKYVWIINAVYQAGKITYEELNEKWLDDDISNGKSLPKRTFDRWREAILDMFGIFIDNERKGEYCYFIQNEDDIKNNGIRSWIFNTYSVTNTLASCLGIKDRILLEYVPSGQEYLQPIIEAMKENHMLNITYYSYWRNEEYNFDVQPYCVKLYRQRWYMVALSEGYDEPRIYALDRIRQLSVTDVTFKMPKNWSAEQYFDGCFGIIANKDIHKQIIKLKVMADQARYIRDLPLHESQQEIERNDDYSIFQYYLRPQFDFVQELLHSGDAIEVLQPSSLRHEMAEIVNNMHNIYNNNKS